MQMRVEQSDQSAKLVFVVQHNATREALDSQIPRLRELFNESGLNLVDVQHHEMSNGEQSNQNLNAETDQGEVAYSTSAVAGETNELLEPNTTHILSLSYQLVDTYA
jgi:flagellar hook-length control protein FliK